MIKFSTVRYFSQKTFKVKTFCVTSDSQITHIHIVPQCLSPVRMGTPHPLYRKRVRGPLPGTKGGTHSPAGEGVGGGPKTDDWRKSPALCLLCTQTPPLPPFPTFPLAFSIVFLFSLTLPPPLPFPAFSILRSIFLSVFVPCVSYLSYSVSL